MSEYDNKNTGVMFKNDRKTEERHPDYTGTFWGADGGEFFCDAWIKRSAKSGHSFLSFRVKPKTQKGAAPTRQAPLAEQLNDDMPF